MCSISGVKYHEIIFEISEVTANSRSSPLISPQGSPPTKFPPWQTFLTSPPHLSIVVDIYIYNRKFGQNNCYGATIWGEDSPHRGIPLHRNSYFDRFYGYIYIYPPAVYHQ